MEFEKGIEIQRGCHARLVRLVNQNVSGDFHSQHGESDLNALNTQNSVDF